MEEVPMKPMPINQANEWTNADDPIPRIIADEANAHEGNADKKMLKLLFSAKLRQNLKHPLV